MGNAMGVVILPSNWEHPPYLLLSGYQKSSLIPMVSYTVSFDLRIFKLTI